MHSTTKAFVSVLAGIACYTATALSANAAQLQIQFTGLNLQYMTFQSGGDTIGDIFDINSFGVGNTLGGNGNPLEADALSFMDFLVDGVSQGTLTAPDIYADIQILDAINIPVGGGSVTTNNFVPFGFDLLTQPGCASNCWGVGLDLDTTQLTYVAGGGSPLSIQGAGLASGLFTQLLPFGLAFDTSQAIAFDFTGTSLTAVSDNDTYLTGFQLAGTGTITGTLAAVPVPAATWLFGSGLIGLAAFARRRATSHH